MTKKESSLRIASEKKQKRPKQTQKKQPGKTHPMNPRPLDTMEHYHGSGKLAGKVALITGGDSGIGRATAIAYAKEGANIAIVYLRENKDANETRAIIEDIGSHVLLIRQDIGKERACMNIIKQTIDAFGRLDILVNNAAEQHPQTHIDSITEHQLVQTFRTNVFAMFFLTKAALPHLPSDGIIINTASVTAYKGNPELLDYSATKGAIVAFTRSLSQHKDILKKRIRVNAIAPGPVWTPLIPSSFSSKEVEEFGNQTPMERAGQPDEIAPAFVFLASDDSTYMSGQVIHINGGTIVNG